MAGVLESIRAGRELQYQELSKALGLSTGKLNPWDLPEYGPLVEGMRTQGSRAMDDLTKNLGELDVGGPASALALERGGEGVNNQILQLANMLKSGSQGQINQWSGFDERLRAQILQKQMFDKQMQAEKMRQITGAIMQGIGMLAGGISGGFSGRGGKGGGGGGPPGLGMGLYG